MNTVGLQMHQMDTGHKGACNTSSPGSVQESEDVREAEQGTTCHQPPIVPNVTGSPIREDEEGNESLEPSNEHDESIVLSPDRLSDAVKKVL